jgi:hypothetical protein
VFVENMKCNKKIQGVVKNIGQGGDEGKRMGQTLKMRTKDDYKR